MRTTVLIPETLVAAGALGLFLAARLPGVRLPRLLALPRRWRARAPGPGLWLSLVALATVLAALAVELWLGSQVGTLFGGGWQQDRFAVFAKAALLVGLAVLIIGSNWRAERLPYPLPLAFIAVFGGMVVASATSLVGLWAGGELAALAGVACAGLTARENGLRLLTVSALAGGLLAVGFAFLYATVGAATLSGLHATLLKQAVTLPLAVVTLLTLSGLAVRLGLAPFQSPAVEGGLGLGPLGAAVFNGLSIATAAIAMAKLLGALAGASAAWGLWLAVLAALAMLGGGIRAAVVPSPRGLIAWLAVHQVGWVAAGLAAHDRRGTAAALFLTGALVVAAVAGPPLAGAAEGGLDRLPGLSRREPARAVGLALVLLSLAGVPPLAGFFGEFLIAAELVRSNLGWVLGCGLLGSVLAVTGVLRVLRLLYLESSLEEVRGGGPRQAPVWALGAFVPGVLVLAYGLFANPIHNLATQGAAALGLN